MDSLTSNPELGHITTFGGHPVNCVAALTNINELLKDNLIEFVEKKGQLFEEIITHPSIKQIRRKGLFFAIEMGSPETVQKVVEGCKSRGVLSFWFLSCPESFRIAPPLNISENEIRISAKIIREVIESIN
jgi:acetylornithine/succinyldiaminopimelate/putrescine aminotransferase